MEFQQSNTYSNLQRAYEIELSENGAYELFAKQANQDVLLEIGFAFDTTSRNALFVSERLHNLISGYTPDTLDNLLTSRSNALASSDEFREYARIAQEEGYEDISSLLSGIANIKLNHASIFENLILSLQNNELFCKPEDSLWICLGCGHILSGECAPDICPICGYPQGFYQYLQTL